MKISEEILHPFVLAFEVNRDFSQYYTCHTRKRFAKQKCKSDDQPIIALRDFSLVSGSRQRKHIPQPFNEKDKVKIQEILGNVHRM